MITQGERRNFIRMSVNTEVTLTRKDGSLVKGLSQNLSATGLSLSMGVELEMDEVVDIYIDSSGPGIRPLEASAHVVRVQKEGDSYGIGLIIDDYK